MSLEALQFLTAAHIPESGFSTGGQHHFAVRREDSAADLISVTAEDIDGLAAGGVPYARGSIRACGHCLFAIGREGSLPDSSRMANELNSRWRVLQVPNSSYSIVAGGGNQPT